MNLDRLGNKRITVGESLRCKREELGISIEDVSRKLKIKISYLKDLEEGNLHKLPPDVYVKGFVRNYAKMIGLDSEAMASLYSREKETEVKKESRSKSLKENFSAPSRAVITPRAITAFFSLLILSAISYYFWYQISSFSSTPYLFISNPPVDEVVVKTSEIVIEGETDANAILKINGEDIFVDSNGYFKANVVLQEGVNTLIVEATNRFGRTAKEKISVIYERKLEPVPAADSDKEIDKRVKEDHFNFEREIEVIGP
jgi:cytoskeletal protein RodZ